MATPVLMPRLSPTMEEGVIAEWLKAEGDDVEAAELLCEIETDKASMEYEAPEEGKLIKILAEPGQTIAVDTLIAIIAEEDEDVDVDAFIKQHSGNGAPVTPDAPVETENEPAAETDQPNVTTPAPSDADHRVKASPLARAMAKDQNIDLSTVAGSGPNGRIIKKDIDHYQPAPAAAPSSTPVMMSDGPEFEDKRNSTMRNVIAKRLLAASNDAPEFYLTMEIDMQRVVDFRAQIKDAMPDAKITFNDIIIKATALALKKNPQCNASWQGDSIRFYRDVHMSVAVAIEDGLITPVIRHADKIGLAEISRQMKELAGRAKDKKLQPEEYTGGTFSISNLGMFGIEQFTSILNPPESGIFAVGAIIDKPIIKNGQMIPGKTMKITMTCDHRVIDGATGAQLLKDVKQILENPALLSV